MRLGLAKTTGRLCSWFLIFLLIGLGSPACAQSSEVDSNQSVTWRHLFRNVAGDQKGIWLSPFRMDRRDAKWWVLFGSVTGGLIATDKWTSKQLPNTEDQIRVSRITSRFGATYSLAPALMAVYLTGAIRKDDHLRETGLLGVEALANGLLVTGAVKVATQRQRPLEQDGLGKFWQGSGRIWNTGASFPSGHATTVWAVASVLAHEYPRPRIIPVAAYGIATAVMASRFTGRRHFASDVVAGAAIGWFIGDYVCRKRHSSSPGSRSSKLGKALSLVSLGQ